MRPAATDDTCDAPAGPLAGTSRPGGPSGDRTTAPQRQARPSAEGPARSAGLAFLPMPLVDFVLAVRVPRLLEWFGRPRVLAAGVVPTAVGMFWLSRLDLHTPCLTGVALPMPVIGAGQGLAPAPMISSGVDGVAPEDTGAGSGLVTTVHQVGSALALSILTAAAATVSTGHSAADVAARTATALTGSAVLLALAVAAVLTLIVPARASRKQRTM
ncbi:hypothetical protein [Streptomyces sp. MBT97]|uniref:hypothetical protein n=1 Tax=Streptomyces sp. MBT97 TaxID=2800411 RepID=UPI001F18CF63|nr:hypothetical protein [Streptomyces sp. MBT97]